MFKIKKALVPAICFALFLLAACGEEAATPTGKWIFSQEETEKRAAFSAMPAESAKAIFDLLSGMTLDLDMNARLITITIRDKSDSGNFEIVSREDNIYTLAYKTETARVALRGDDLLEFKSDNESLMFKRAK